MGNETRTLRVAAIVGVGSGGGDARMICPDNARVVDVVVKTHLCDARDTKRETERSAYGRYERANDEKSRMRARRRPMLN